MNQDDLFDRMFHQYGGRLQRDQVEPELMKELDGWLYFFRSIIDSGQEGEEFITGSIHIDYIDNSTVNAIATQTGRGEFIGLFLGATMYIYDAFSILATHPAVFKGIGQTKARLAKGSIKTHLLRTDKHHFLDINSPLDRRLWILAQGATMITQFFLFGHEVGHLIYGHIRYLMSQTGSTEILEYPVAPLGANALRSRRVLEFDADRHGAIVSLNWWGRHSEQSGQDVRFGLDTFYLWGFSLGVLFRLMDMKTTNPNQESTSTHPMPDVRFAHAFICGLEEVMKRFPNRTEEFKTEVSKASNDLRELWLELELPAESFRNWRQGLGEAVAEYRSTLEQLKDDCLDQLAWTRSDEIRENR